MRIVTQMESSIPVRPTPIVTARSTPVIVILTVTELITPVTWIRPVEL